MREWKLFLFDTHERDIDVVVIFYSGRRSATSQQTVKAGAQAAKREIQRRALSNNKPDAGGKSGLTSKPTVINRPKRVELVNFRGVLVPKEVALVEYFTGYIRY